MAVEKMKLLSVVGKEENIENFISEYLIESGMQPEDALKVYEKGWKLSYFDYDTRAKETLKRCQNIMDELGLDYSENYKKVKLEYRVSEIIKALEPIETELENASNDIVEANNKIERLEETKISAERLKNIDIEVSKLYNSRYMKFRYGRMAREYYEKVKIEIENMDVIMSKIEEEENSVWIVYFTTKEFEAKVDSYFNVMKFERMWISKEIDGVPKDMIKKIDYAIDEKKNEIEAQQKYIKDMKNEYESTLVYIYRQLLELEKVNYIKKYFAHDNNHNFYLIGWMPDSELKEILPKLSKEKDLQYKIKNHDEVANTPPTHLKNNKIISKFEKIVEMYGVPNYSETDPTVFVAITAFLMFGFMFGDVGQGLCIVIIGLILSKRKIGLGPILTAGGISAIIFGFLYGSIFGKEGILPSLLISPMEDITTMLISGIAFGVVLILIAMLINIKNGIKNRDIKKIFFSENGLAGLLFYSIIIGAVVYYFAKGKMIVSFGILAFVLFALLMVIMFKDRLEQRIRKNKNKENSSIVEMVSEILEMLLSIASNTISFVRLSAFAINHVGLCMAVYILADMVSGAGNIATIIIGNVIVVVLEGLIVAIQVLRLEYYELFSRFYQGDGKAYRPIKSEV